VSVDAAGWIDRLAAALGTEPPTEEEIEAVLGLAGLAARASERIAAPVSCWLVARAGVPPVAAIELVRRLADEVAADDRPTS
jgi:hypothetical protein